MTAIVKAHITTIDKQYIRSSVDICRPAKDTIVLRGQFKHQGHPCDYAVYTAISDDKPITQRGDLACLSAMASVISDPPTAQPNRVNVTNGDIIDVDGKLYHIRDDVPLGDPRLELIDGPADPEKMSDALASLFTEQDDIPDVIDHETGVTADEILGDSDPEIYGGAAVIGDATMTVWWDRFATNGDDKMRSVYGVNVTTAMGQEWEATDVFAPNMEIDVDEARRVIASMLHAEINQSTGDWDSDLVTWAIHNDLELAKVAVA